MAVRNRQMMHADALIDSLWRRVERQAAEITRLRAGLQTIIDRAKNDPDARAHEMADIAINALAPDEQTGIADQPQRENQ